LNVAIRQGRCTSFGNCGAADRKQIFQIADGADFVCSECGRQLTDMGRKTGGGGAALGIVLAAVFVMLGLAGFALFRLIGHHASSGTVSFSTGGSNSGKVILRLSGSNTIGSDLVPALAQAFLKDQGAVDARIVAGANSEEKSVEGTLPGDSSPSIVQIQAHGSATAFTALADGSCDIGMASRKIAPDEIAKLSSIGDMTSPAAEHILGLDGIAVIVNQANSASSLTKDQLAAIFSGATADWSSVGGRGGSIQVYARDDKSGTYDSFKSMVLKSGSLVSSARRYEDSATLSDAVANDPNGIGFIGLPYVRSAKAVAVSERGAMPMLPNRFTVATEDYPLSRRLYLYTPENPQNRYTRKFVQFALSKTGQDIVAANSFVAQTVVGERETVASGAPAEYKRLTDGAERLSVDFRFRTGRADLDNKAIVDLDRVIGFVSDLHYSGDSVLLFGFADSTGGSLLNQKLSEDRAKTVEQQFEQRGLHPGTVRGFGSNLPVASNDTDEGREKNRRVEIWVRK
jgi:phosphate transport system substrate-binding protein